MKIPRMAEIERGTCPSMSIDDRDYMKDEFAAFRSISNDAMTKHKHGKFIVQNFLRNSPYFVISLVPLRALISRMCTQRRYTRARARLSKS